LARYDFRSPRLYVEAALAPDATIALGKSQAHYLGHVLRLKGGDTILAFNGRDGEWRAGLSADGKRTLLAVKEQTREQTTPPDLHYLFAPLKHERLDYMVQKAVELGVSRLQPVLTRHTQVQRVNLARMRANAIEAAEQCGILSIPEIGEPLTAAAERTGARRDGYRSPGAGGVDRTGRRLCRGGARGVVEAAEYRAPVAWAAHPARRHGGGGGACPGAGRARRLALGELWI
jgi:hypothetical protein